MAVPARRRYGRPRSRDDIAGAGLAAAGANACLLGWALIGRMLARVVVLACALLLAGCKVDAIAPVNISDIDRALSTKQPVDLTARLLLTFTSRKWCEDMGASLVVTLKSAGLDMTPVACAQDPAGTNWHGELRMPVRLKSTVGSGATANGDLASLEVRPNGEKPDAYSIVAHLDVPRLEAARERLLALPAAQDTDDARIFDLSVTIMLRNDRAKPAILDGGAMTSEADAQIIEIPVDGVRTISLSNSGVNKLLSERSVVLFSIRGEKAAQ